MSTVMDPVANYAGDFARLSARGSAEPAWLSSVRRRAFDAFERRGFPTTRDEEWRSTSVAPIAETEFVRAAGGSELVDRAFVDACRLPDTATELVFVNGEYAASLSRVGALPQGVRVDRLTDALAGGAADLEPHLSHIASFGQEPFVAMNTALWTEGVVVRIAPKAVLASPIHLVFVSTQGQGGGRPTLSHPRVLIIAGVLSQVSVVETYAGLGRYFTNSVTEVAVADQAIVNHYKLQRESDTAFHIATIQARTGTGGSFNAHSMSFGGALVRNDIVVTLDGEGCQSTLDGLYVVDQTRLVDNHTTIDHAKPHCDSREIYKGILADRSRAVFNGKIMVRQDAQKTDAKQTNKALLLSEDAQINTKPQLEIFANDVKCTHGAAVGQMDEDALFYLRARGLPIDQARQILIHAFAGDVLNRMPLASVRTRAEAELTRRLVMAGGQ